MVVISLLRGVNVGGHNKIPMEALRKLYVSLGLEKPRSHIQSGNVIFGTREKKLPELAARIAGGIEKSFGARVDVILRTPAELKDVVARSPFAGRSEVLPNRLLVTFFAEEPGAEALENLRKLPATPEELHLLGRELYIYFPNGFSNSKIPATALDKALKVRGTARNWNTVCKLLELGEAW